MLVASMVSDTCLILFGMPWAHNVMSTLVFLFPASLLVQLVKWFCQEVDVMGIIFTFYPSLMGVESLHMLLELAMAKQ